ncbi:MAG: adenylate kinase family protein [Candidatus Woesearchaeota archaeon]
MENMRIAILGPQGSGKGTQAVMIAEKYGLSHIDMGKELRKRQETDDELGRMIKEIMLRGDMLPDDVPYKIFHEQVSLNNNKFIVDGFPRSIEQLRMALQITEFDVALYIKISDEEAVRRISKRKICDKCKKTYIWNDNMSPKCDCGGNIIQREDDTQEAVMKRLSLYHQNTELLIREYTDKNILIEVDGEQEISKVFEDASNAIDNIMSKDTRAV